MGMSDLIKTLREHGKFYRAESQYSGHYPAGDAMFEAADEIERLNLENENLKAAISDVRDAIHGWEDGGEDE